MSAIKISTENYDGEVLKSDKPVLLDFYADWCPSCRTLGPIIDQIASERSDIKVGKININDDKMLADKFGVKSIPSLFVLKNGNIVNKSVGVKSKSAILEML